MKYIFTIAVKRAVQVLLMFTFSAFQSTAQSTRMVLIEEVTQASCGACAAQNPTFDALLQSNADKVVVLKYHASSPGYDRMNLDNPQEVQSRLIYYGFAGLPPVAFINGAYVADDCGVYEGAPFCLDQLDINLAHNESPIFDLEVNATYVNNTLNITGTLRANESIDGDLKLRLALAEQAIQYGDAPGGTNGELLYPHVFKKFIPDADGIDLNDSWASDDIYTINESIDLAGETIYDHTTLELIAFVQDDSDGNIIQAAKDTDIPLTVSFADNAIASNIKDVPQELCTGEQTITPTLTLQNGGNNTLTSAEIVYDVNGGTTQSFTWEGTLSTLAREDVVLPDYTFDVLTSNGVTISVQNPNGNNDENTADNTVQVGIVSANEPTDNNVRLQLTTDDYPEETVWQMRSSSGEILFNGGPYNESETHIIEMLLPQDDCYEFEIFDLLNDGICCASGQGVYQLTDSNGNLLGEGGQFTTSEQTLLMLTNSETINNNASIIAYTGPNEEFFCDAFNLSPSLTIRNIGSNDITTLDIEVRDMTGNVLSTNVLADTIFMAPAGEIEVQLADVLLENTTYLSFHITGVNGIVDSYINGNAYTDVLISEVARGSENLTMTLNTDCWPDENTWQVLDEAGNIVQSGGPYMEEDAQMTITESFTLSTYECYQFVFMDEHGDGLFGSQWADCSVNGNITLSDAQGNLLFEYDGSQSTFEERGSFSYGELVSNDPVIFREGLTINPNPTQGNFILDFTLETSMETTVSIHNMLGAEVTMLNLGKLSSGQHVQNIDIGNLTNGMYIVTLNVGTDAVSQKIVLTR